MAVTTESASARARAAARTLATLGRGPRTRRWSRSRVALERETAAIVEANAEDLAAARAAGQSSALIDRLTLDAGRVLELCDAVRAIAALEDPVGDVVSRLAAAERPRHPEGARAARRAARRLRGAPERHRGRRRPVPQERQRLPPARLDERAPHERRPAALRARGPRRRRAARGCRDLARGHARRAGGDRRRPRRRATWSSRAAARGSRSSCSSTPACPCSWPPAATATSTCTRTPIPAKALPIVINAKTQRPGVCNAAETLIVHRDALPLLGPIGAELAERGVELRADAEAAAALGAPSAARRRGGLGDGVPRPGARGAHGGLGRGGDRPHRALLHRALRGDRDREPRGGGHLRAAASRAPASTSTPRPASPTAASSGSAPRSATRPPACTRAARSGSPTSRRRSTSCTATARSAPSAARQPWWRRRMTQPLWPPRPIEFESAYSMSTLRAPSGT